MDRKITKQIKIGDKFIGGNNPILVQSMTNTKTSDVDSTVSQIIKLQNAGCEIVRVSIPDEASANAISKIKEQINIPLVGDIHFDYKLALLAIENGIDKIRINPGNIGSKDRIREVANACKNNNIPIRVGVNSGSISKDIIAKYNGITPEGMIEEAIRNISILEEFDFNDIVVSIKASNIPLLIKSNILLSSKLNYPLHIGLTEAGPRRTGEIKSATCLGAILTRGIGDTIRVSLSDDPKEEVIVARKILNSLNLRKDMPTLISCPTCARTNIDVINISEKVEKALSNINKNVTVAVMGCAVNGPGEAKEADIGIAGGNGEALLFKKGEICYKVKEDEIIDVLIREINKF